MHILYIYIYIDMHIYIYISVYKTQILDEAAKRRFRKNATLNYIDYNEKLTLEKST